MSKPADLYGTAAPTYGRRQVAAWLIVVVALFHLVTIRDGHGWHDDFAAYIAHARNMTNDNGYAETGYIYDERNPHAGPEAYPPVFPALLAPIVAATELRLWPMKAEQVALLVVWLLVLLAWFRQRDRGMATIVVALIGFSPFISLLKDNVLSDIAFAAAFVGTLALADDDPEKRPGGLIGLLGVLAFGTRTLGFVLIPVLWVDDLLHRRKITFPTIVATGTFALGAAIITVFVGGDGGYADNLRMSSPRLALVNAWRYLRSLEGLTANGYSARLGTVLLVVLLVLVVLGVVRRVVREGLSVVETSIVLYGGLIAVWPAFQSLRFLLPLLPFVFSYAVEGADGIARIAGVRPVITRAVLVAAFLVSYAGAYTAIGFEPVAEGVEQPETKELFAFLRANASGEDVIMFPRPRALALYTGQRSVAFPLNADDIRSQIRRFDVTIVIDSPIDPAARAYVRTHREQFRRIFRNDEFRVYRLRQARADS